MEAFAYCWTDLGTNKLYVGVHKGTPEDGYVCSSKLMLEEHTKRPNDFSRQILARGTFKEMYVFETAILKAAGADKDPGYYNLSVNSPKAPETHSEKSKKKMSLSRIKYMEHNNQTMKKEQHPMWGRPHTEVHCARIGNALRGKTRSDEAKKNAGLGRAGYYQITTPNNAILCVKGLVKFCKLYNLHLSNLFNRGKSKGYACEKLVKQCQ